MEYIVESINRRISQKGALPFTRSIIGEVSKVAELNRAAARSLDKAGSYLLIYEAKYQVGPDVIQKILGTFDAIDRNAIVSPRILTIGEAPGKKICVGFDVRIPFPDWRCMILDSALVSRFGSFDESYATVEDAVIEFGLRVNDAGFTSLYSNDAWVIGSNTIGENVPSPYIEMISSLGLENLCKSLYLDSFIPFAATSDERTPKILFDFHDMPPFHCGTTEYEIALLKYFKKLYAQKYQITIRCNEAAVEFHGLHTYFDDIIYPDDDAGLFDLGFVATQPINFEKQVFLNEHCLRIVYTMLDCILLRTNYLVAEHDDVEDVARCGLRNCDGIVAISNFSQSDYKDFFSSDPIIQRKPSKVVYIATDFGNETLPDKTDNIPFASYVLVVGNTYKHKALKNTLDAVANTDINYIFVGLPENIGLPSNVVSFPHAVLSEAFLISLYAGCRCAVFPSQYEGFGLPITIAFKHGKKVIVSNNDLNHEIQDHFSDFEKDVYFFSSFDEIPSLIKECMQDEVCAGKFTGSWRSAIIEVEEFISGLLEVPLDWRFIDERQWQYRMIAEQSQSARKETENQIGFKRLIWERFVEGHLIREKLFKKLGWADDLDHISEGRER